MGLLQRKLAREEPFPKAWRKILREHVPFYSRYGASDRKRFEEKLKVFVWTKHFIAGGNFTIDDKVKVVIAAGAARLALNVEGEEYARLTEIVVYNNAWEHPDTGGVHLGEAHSWGTVVLSWQNVLAGLANETDGRDLSLHEFAHVLDRADGAFDGTPILPSRFAYGPWVAAMSREFLALRKGKKSVLRQYGATNEAEFFAVATEAFFEKPLAVRERHPELYDVLADYFNQDPARDLEKRRKKP